MTQLPYEDLISLVPAYVNGTLTTEERAAVDAALAGNAALKDEVEAYQKIAAAIREPRSSNADVSAFAWRRLQAEIRREPTKPKERLNAETRIYWRYAAAALGVIALGQSVALFVGVGRNAPAEYALAGEQTHDFAAKVLFQDSAKAQDISALLLGVNAQITGGPSARGLYEIRFENREDLAAALAHLRARSDLVDQIAPA